MARTYRITLKTIEGMTLFTGSVVSEEIVEIRPRDTAAAVGNGPASGEPQDRMTDPQRRYMFRLLAAQGFAGKQAEEHLKEHFEVSRLADVSRQAASEYIDRLLKGPANEIA
jgi:hypothetical protein